MCSIMGYCSCDVTYDDFKAAFERTKSRGPDDTRVIFTGKGLLGFHRLAIMGLHPEGMQPFELDGSAVVCNGEIYGFERIKQILQQKGYSFHSQSDCEILLPLYKEYGTAMFRMLDAEFALMPTAVRNRAATWRIWPRSGLFRLSLRARHHRQPD